MRRRAPTAGEAAAAWFAGRSRRLLHPSWDRSRYLDAAERLVRACLPYWGPDGLLHDPLIADAEPLPGTPAWMVRHSYAGTARFVGGLARLVMAGRCTDLRQPGMLALDAAARVLWEGREAHRPAAEFETIELVDGLRAFGPQAGSERAERWRRWLGEPRPELLYGDVFSVRPEPRNGNTFAVASEQARIAAGLGGDPGFVERYLAYQQRWFDGSGMYVDPGAPLVYDLTVRKNLVLLRDRGYGGEHSAWIDGVLERGGLVSLLTQSAAGQAPFGGRSNQYLFVEATLACVLEHEARRYAARGQAAEAGAFVRAARLALESALPWIELDPPRHLRNAYPPHGGHGTDSYGLFTVYAPLAATLFAAAWHLADPSIPEAPCPADEGAAAFALEPAFHKIFVRRKGWSVEIDTAGDPAHDATGMGQVHRAGVPGPLALSGPCPAKPVFRTAAPGPWVPAAIGPAWRDGSGAWHALAAVTASDVESWDLEVSEAADGRPDATITWRLHSPGTLVVAMRIDLGDANVRIRATVEGAGVSAVGFTLPLQASDGSVDSLIAADEGIVTCRLRGALLRAACPGASLAWEPLPAVSRNGTFRVARWESAGRSIECVLDLEGAAGLPPATV